MLVGNEDHEKLFSTIFISTSFTTFVAFGDYSFFFVLFDKCEMIRNNREWNNKETPEDRTNLMV